MKKQFSKGFGKYGSCVLSRKWNKGFLIAATAVLLLSNPLFAQSNASKQPLPTFKYRTGNTADTARQCKVVHGRETKAEKSRLSGFVTHIYIYIYIWRNLKNKQEKIVNVSDKLLILQKIN